MKDLAISYPKQQGECYFEYEWDAKRGKASESGLPLKYTSVNAGPNSVERIPGGSAEIYHYTNCYQKVSPSGDKVSLTEYRADGSFGSEQVVKKNNAITTKQTRIVRDCEDRYSSIQILDNESGAYSIVRKKGNEIIGGYEFLPGRYSVGDDVVGGETRKLATGFRGKVEKLGMAIATDANGCERPILRRVGGFILNLAKRIK